jgi:hypothetical protein
MLQAIGKARTVSTLVNSQVVIRSSPGASADEKMIAYSLVEICAVAAKSRTSKISGLVISFFVPDRLKTAPLLVHRLNSLQHIRDAR